MVGTRVKMSKEVFCCFYERLDAETKKELLMGYKKMKISVSRSSSKMAPENSEVKLKAQMSS